MPLGADGPEDVVVDEEGRLVTGVADGRILCVDPQDGRVESIAETGGRPMGIERSGDGRLIVCDAHRGLLRVDPANGAVEVLVADIGGQRIVHCNNAAVHTDGTIYFSDSSRRFGFDHWKADLLEHSGTGRLLRRDPGGEVEVLLDGLQFANGVALARDERFVVVAETGSYRLTRLWLMGERAGSSDVFVDILPGFPDNIALGTDGLIWVAVASRRNPMLDRLHRMHPVWRRVAWAVPERFQPAAKAPLWVLGLDDDGAVVHDVQGSSPDYHFVTGVREHGGRVYLASFHEPALAVIDL